MSVEEALESAEHSVRVSDQAAMSSGEGEVKALRDALRAHSQAIHELLDRVKELEEHPMRRIAGQRVKG